MASVVMAGDDEVAVVCNDEVMVVFVIIVEVQVHKARDSFFKPGLSLFDGRLVGSHKIEGLADHVPGQAGNPLSEPAAAGPANYNQYQYGLMVHGNGYNTYEESMQARYPYLHNTPHHYPSPQASYPYYELPPMYFPQPPPPPRNAKAGEPDLCSIM
ncbi:hypothetical protein D5086_000161 [Populus alba]|uniref:Uncharacterized protein n=3 Tax=Populus TaxID=3689 RepID=A0A4U5Q2L0_POPAL|nr:hypothetical protein NC653_000321 [Populus alba x Populus x berolinensis]TKS03811.1 hypothetical protein D5086_0000149570 [Populus alba]